MCLAVRVIPTRRDTRHGGGGNFALLNGEQLYYHSLNNVDVYIWRLVSGPRDKQ